MTPVRPYLLRAQYDWIVDNELTPLLVANAAVPGMVVPADFIEHEQIVLNISPRAVRGLSLANDSVAFSGRFQGVAQDICIPMAAVKAIYARENGRGMIFEDEFPIQPPAEEPVSQAPEQEQGGAQPKRGKASLKVVK